MAEKKTDSTKTTAGKTTVKVTAKPATTAKTTATAKTTVTAKPATTAKTTPASTVKPATTVKTTATVKPVTTAKPASASTAKPVAPAKTTVTAKPATPAKATVTAKPATTVKTTATVKPVSKNTEPVTVLKTSVDDKTQKANAKPASAPLKPSTAKPVAPVKETAKTSLKEEPVKKATPEPKEEKVQKAEKAEKPAKEKKVKEKSSKSGEGSGRKVPGWVAAINQKVNWRFVGLVAGICIFITACLLGLTLGLRACRVSPDDLPGPGGNFGTVTDIDEIVTVTSYKNAHNNTTQVGYSAEIVGTVDRYKPVAGVRDGGLGDVYPKYGSTKNLTAEQKNAVLAENRNLCAKATNTGGVYDWMDKDGYLYTGTRANPTALNRQLYKHTGSVGLYLGDVADNEPAVVKNLTFRPRTYNSYYSVTGLYAPAGEVIKIQMSEADMDATGGITIHIGQALYNGQANNIWAARGFNRMPVILNTMNVTKDYATLENGVWTAYVGSFLGGPIYVRSENATFSMTISGGVNYSHFILGVTTEEEFNALSKSSAPYFDLEVWDSGVLHSGPKNYAKSFSYKDIYKAAVLWEKVASVTTYSSNQGIVFIYDPFVAAGAAVAFPGRRSVNCPAGWMTSSLNYNSIVTSGAWGNFHEYHHNFQNYGVGDRGEVTNNALTLVSYSLFTKISASRQIASYGGAGLSGWNQYTVAPWTLNRVNAGGDYIKSTNGLAVYATLLHNFGQDVFIKSRGVSDANYYNKFAENTHQDMSYFADLVSSYGRITGSQLAQNDYPMFVPVSSVYQTGRSYVYDGEKKDIETMQPFVIPYGQPYTFDLNEYTVNDVGQYQSGSIVIAKDFKFKVKSVDNSDVNGTLVKTGENIYKFTPNSELRSGKIRVTLEITTLDGEKTYNGKTLDDVDLILEFQQSHETNKTVLERTIYKYTEETKYTDAVTAFESGFDNYQSVETVNHTNPTQNANTDIWFWPNDDSSHNAHPNSPDYYFITDNEVHVIDGKLYFTADGKYRVFLRGRLNCALYYSFDGENYALGGRINDSQKTDKFRPGDPNTYFDVEFNENNVYVNSGKDPVINNFSGERWLYIKEILIVQSSPATSYIGVGMKEWTEPMYTAEVKYYIKDNGSKIEVTQETTDTEVNYYYISNGNKTYVENGVEILTETVYKDGNGKIVEEEIASNKELIPPVVTDKSQPYVNAYRRSYEFQKEFTSDYFYKREYRFGYSERFTGESIVGDPKCPSNFPIENLFDDDPSTACASPAIVSASAPWVLTVDMGRVIEANRFELTGYKYNNSNNKNQTPNSITLYLGETLEDMVAVKSFDNGSVSGINLQFNFDKTKFRYYKLEVRKTVEGRFAAIGHIEFVNNNAKGVHLSPDNEIFSYKGEWQSAQTNSTFGHVYVGKNNSTMEFEVEGKQFAILSSKNFERNFEVYIDGNLVETVPTNITEYVFDATIENQLLKSSTLKAQDCAYSLSYFSPELTSGKHKVVIKCKGEATIDSVVLF